MKNLWPYLLFWCCGTPFFATAQAVRTTVSSAAAPPIRTTISPAAPSIRTTILPAAPSIRTTLSPAPATVLTIVNDSILSNYTGITLDWQLLVNGQPRQKGAVPGLQLLPGHPRTLRLPLKPPAAGDEAWLKLDYYGASRTPPASPRTPTAPTQASPGRSPSGTRSRPPLATQFLPWQPWNADIHVPVSGELSFTDSNNIFTIISPTLHASFDKETGWIRELTVDNYPLVTDTNGIRLNLPSFPHLQLFSTSTGSRMVIVRTEYTLPDQSWLLHLSYTFNSAGVLLVEETLEKDTTRPDSLTHPLGPISMNLTLPREIDSISWYGLMAGNRPPTGTATYDTIPSIHRLPLAAASVATSVRWFSAYDHHGDGIQGMADSTLLGIRSADPNSSILRLDEHDDTPPTQMRAGHKLAFKLTPLSILSHPAPPPPAPTHPAPTRTAPTHPAPTKKPPQR